VIWTSGGIDKLEAYLRLRVQEVWSWKDGKIDVHVLSDGAYQKREQSAALPGLDLALVTRLLDQPTAIQAVKAMRRALGGG
jgi:hypothetical protein